MLFPVAAFFIIILVYLFFTKSENYWKNLGVPYAKPTFLVGNLLPLLKQETSRAEFFGNLYSSSSHPYYGFFSLLQPSLLIRDPVLIKNILIKDFEHFTNRQSGKSDSDKIVSNALFFLRNEKWRQLRAHLSPLFSSGKLRNMCVFIEDVSDNVIKYINGKIIGQKLINCMDMICMYNTDIIATCFFGFNASALNNGNQDFYMKSLQLTNSTFLRNLQATCRLILPRVADFFGMKLFDQNAERYLQNTFLDVMEIRKKNGSVRGDLVDLLVKIQEENVISYFEIVAQPLQFHFAGFDTSCNTIAFTLIELSLNPNIQAKLRGEIKKVLAKHHSFSYETLQEMTYLGMVVSETLRLHPTIPILDRVCNKPYKIPGTEVVIKEGTPVVISTYGIHHDEKYFLQADKFDPERFSQCNKSKIIPCSYIPFGDGPRNCIGLRFALLSVKMAVAKIINNFEVELGGSLKSPILYDIQNFFMTPNNRVLDLKFKPLNIVCSD